MARGTARPFSSQIVGQRSTHIRRQRQAMVMSTFSPDQYLTRFPVYIVQLQLNHFAGAQAQSGHEQ
jgi:hypothetical protein